MAESHASQGANAQATKHGLRRVLLIIGVWVVLVLGIQYYAWRHMLHPLDLLQGMVHFCRMHAASPLLFLGVAALSPLALIPAALLGVVAGLCFGPVFGVLYTLIGCNISATITYSLGRLSDRSMSGGEGRFARLLERYGPPMRSNSILYIILLRLSFLPYDPINYLIGLMRVPWARFILANTLGSLPGVIAIVLAGSSVNGLDHGLPMFNPTILIGGVALLLLSLGVAALLKRRADRVERVAPID